MKSMELNQTNVDYLINQKLENTLKELVQTIANLFQDCNKKVNCPYDKLNYVLQIKFNKYSKDDDCQLLNYRMKKTILLDHPNYKTMSNSLYDLKESTEHHFLFLYYLAKAGLKCKFYYEKDAKDQCYALIFPISMEKHIQFYLKKNSFTIYQNLEYHIDTLLKEYIKKEFNEIAQFFSLQLKQNFMQSYLLGYLYKTPLPSTMSMQIRASANFQLVQTITNHLVLNKMDQITLSNLKEFKQALKTYQLKFYATKNLDQFIIYPQKKEKEAKIFASSSTFQMIKGSKLIKN